MKKRNVVDKFVGFFRKLNSFERKNLWDLVSAFRGPDSGDSKLKECTTERIRGEVFSDPDFSIFWNETNRVMSGGLIRVEPLTEDLLKEGRKRLNEADWHFRAHIENALKVLVTRNPECLKDVKELFVK